MKRNLTVVFTAVLILAIATAALSQFGMRKIFRGNGDNHRNLVMLENAAQLQTTFALTSSFSSMFDVRLDSIPDGAAMELNVDLGTLSTGNSALDMETFSARFLDWKGNTQASFKLIDLIPGRAYTLENEKATQAAGRGLLTLGSRMDTVTVEMTLRYLEANEITRGRLPGDLLHAVGTVYFRLSDFGIQIPQEALLRLDDRMKLKFDIYNSTQM